MKHKTFFAVLVMAIAMTGCLKVQKKSEVAAAKEAKAKPVKAQPKQVNNRELRLDDVFVEFEGQAQPNIYDMVFSWPETRDRVRISVDGHVAFAVNTSERTSEAIDNLQGGRKVSVLVEILDQQFHVITSETRDLEIPKDYVFPKNYRLMADMTVANERVFMSAASITTQQFNLTIKTKKLIVLEKSYIQNFSTGEKAAPIKHGRNGGVIRIEAETAEGDLDITVNSEAGGDGFKAVKHETCPAGANCFPSPSCPWGGSGLNAGRNGDLYVKVAHSSDFKLYYQEELAVGGNVGPAHEVPTDKEYPVWSPYGIALGLNMQCVKNPVQGNEAQPGKICLTFSGQVPQQGCE